jgi:hypothetical protein
MPTATQSKPQQKAGPAAVPWAKQKYVSQKKSASKEPLLIHLFSAYFVFRSVLFLLIAFILSFPQESPFSKLIVSHAVLFIRHVPYDVIVGNVSLREFLMVLSLLMGILYGIGAWKWIVRFWLARWAMMFVAGATALKGILALATPGPRLSGLDAAVASVLVDMSPAQTAVLVFNILLNGTLCILLMFYPGFEQAFEKSELPGIS